MTADQAAVWVAAVSAIIAVAAVVVSIVFGVKSTQAAKRSADAAESSAAEASHANARAARAEQRAVARNDVVLRTFLDGDTLMVVNDGLDAALSTTVTIRIWGEEPRHKEIGDVPPSSPQKVLDVAAQLDHEEAELAEWGDFEAVLTYDERFSWRSEGGAPHQLPNATRHVSRQ